MFEFLKSLLKKENFKSNRKEINQLNKIIYFLIFLCAVCFVGFMIYFVIKQLPIFMDNLKINWNDSKTIFNGLKP